MTSRNCSPASKKSGNHFRFVTVRARRAPTSGGNEIVATKQIPEEITETQRRASSRKRTLWTIKIFVEINSSRQFRQETEIIRYSSSNIISRISSNIRRSPKLRRIVSRPREAAQQVNPFLRRGEKRGRSRNLAPSRNDEKFWPSTWAGTCHWPTLRGTTRSSAISRNAKLFNIFWPNSPSAEQSLWYKLWFQSWFGSTF